jgi:hypothetical protein
VASGLEGVMISVDETKLVDSQVVRRRQTDDENLAIGVEMV